MVVENGNSWCRPNRDKLPHSETNCGGDTQFARGVEPLRVPERAVGGADEIDDFICVHQVGNVDLKGGADFPDRLEPVGTEQIVQEAVGRIKHLPFVCVGGVRIHVAALVVAQAAAEADDKSAELSFVELIAVD